MFDSSRISKLIFAGLADLYVASVAARFVERFWPTARVLTFAVIASSLIAIDLAAVIVEARRGKHSTLTIWLIHLGFFFTGIAVVLVIGGLVERRFAEGWGTIVDSWGITFWGTYWCCGVTFWCASAFLSVGFSLHRMELRCLSLSSM